MVCAIRVLFPKDFDVEIFPVEAGDEFIRRGKFERGANILPDPGGGGGSERQANRLGEALAHFDEHAIFRAKVVTPFRDAVRFVDGEQIYFHAGEK